MNPAQPAPGTALCPLAAIRDPGGRGFSFRSGDYLFMGFVVRRAGLVAGYVDRCPHAGLPLALAPNYYLTREKDLILCASHGALFRLEDGFCVGGPCADRSLTPWPVRIEGEMVVTA